MTHLLIPLPLAELLFVTLGPLSEALALENHRWTPVVKMVLSAYMNGRDDQLTQMYGNNVAKDVDIVTVQVSEELARWVEDLAEEEDHFLKWDKEIRDDPAD